MQGINTKRLRGPCGLSEDQPNTQRHPEEGMDGDDDVARVIKFLSEVMAPPRKTKSLMLNIWVDTKEY